MQNSLCVTGHGSVLGSILGTPGYMSPEQARGDIEIDHRTDIFSLGAILTFMLTGSAPGELAAASASVPRPLRAICEKAIAADPNARYQSAREMTADITHYLNGEPVSAYPEGLLERSGRVFARHRTAVVLVAVYLIMRVLFILFARR
jgi:eukaryotic-like serine/threonine-protein kinase